MTTGPLPGGDPIPRTVVRLAVGLAFGTVGMLLELGLDQVVVVAPWLIVGFATVLAAAILGGPLGGATAGAIGVAGAAIAIPAWVPGAVGLEGAGWPFELVTALVALAAGLGIRRVIRSGWPHPGSVDRARDVARQGGPASRGSTTTAPETASVAELAIVAGAVRDVGAVRTAVQAADALARHAAALTDAGSAIVYLPSSRPEVLVPEGRSGESDRSAPERIAIDSIESFDGEDGRAALVPLVIEAGGKTRVVGAVRLIAAGATLRRSPLLPVVLALATGALERVRLDGARRSADDDAAGAGRRLAILGGLALELVGGRTIDDVSATLLAFAVDDLGAGFAAVHVADEGTNGFRLAGSRGYPAGVIAAQTRIAADAASPVTRAAAAREPVEVIGEEGWREAFPRTSNVPAITGVRAISAVPMIAGDAVHGVLTIGWRTGSGRSDADRGLLAAAAAQAAQALERAILHAHDEDARRFQEAFIGVVSHELRTPITTILAGSRLLKRRLAADAAAADLSDDIVIEADRLARIVDDLLVLSRLERRHLAIGDDPVHLDHLLARVVRSEANRWPGHGFDLPTSPNRHVVLGEETYVEQVLRNILSNAAKYSPPGSTIRITIDDLPDGVVEVRVLDEGPGVAPAELDELFSLFYRSPTTAATAAGAGIGLFVSRQLVTEMGGRVWARPRPEGGSEFGFSLASYPIDEPEPYDDGEPPPAPSVIAAGSPDDG